MDHQFHSLTRRRVLVPQSDEDEDKVYDKGLGQKSRVGAVNGRASWMNAGNRMELLSASIRGKVLVSPWRHRQRSQQPRHRQDSPSQSQQKPQLQASLPPQGQEQKQEQQRPRQPSIDQKPHFQEKETRAIVQDQRIQNEQRELRGQVTEEEPSLVRVKEEESDQPRGLLHPSTLQSNLSEVQEPQRPAVTPSPVSLGEKKIKQEQTSDREQVQAQHWRSELDEPEAQEENQGNGTEETNDLSMIPASPIVANHISPTSWQHEPSVDFLDSTPVQEPPMYTQSLTVAPSRTPSSNSSAISTPIAATVAAVAADEGESLAATKERSFQRSSSTPNLPSSSPQAAESFSKKKKRKRRQSQSTASSPVMSSSMMFAADLSDITSYLERDLSGFETRPSF